MVQGQSNMEYGESMTGEAFANSIQAIVAAGSTYINVVDEWEACPCSLGLTE